MSFHIDVEEQSPYLQKRSKNYFHGEHFEIVDPDDINKILTAIRKAKPAHLNHPQSIWRLRLTLHTKDQNIVIHVHKTRSADNGTYFRFPRRGDLRTDRLARVLVKLIRNRR